MKYYLAVPALLLAGSAGAQPVRYDQVPPVAPTETLAAAEAPPVEPKFTGLGLSWAQTLLKRGRDRKALVGARAFGTYDLGYRFVAHGRADASASQSQAQEPVTFQDLDSYSNLEAYLALGYKLNQRGTQLLAIYGLGIPMDAGKPKLLNDFPKTAAIGVSQSFKYGPGAGFVLVTFGRHDAASVATEAAATEVPKKFDKLSLTVQAPLPYKVGLYIVGDAVMCVVRSDNCAAFSRVGLAYKF